MKEKRGRSQENKRGVEERKRSRDRGMTEERGSRGGWRRRGMCGKMEMEGGERRVRASVGGEAENERKEARRMMMEEKRRRRENERTGRLTEPALRLRLSWPP